MTEDVTDNPLLSIKPRQMRAVFMLIDRQSCQSTADKLRVSKRTVLRWKKQPAFMTALRETWAKMNAELRLT